MIRKNEDQKFITRLGFLKKDAAGLARIQAELARSHFLIVPSVAECFGLVYCEAPPGPKFHWVPLFEYSLFPVCSPALAAQMGAVLSPADLLTQPLVAIYTEVQNWSTWFQTAGLAFDPSSPYLVVDTLAVALEMALDGQAIALVNGPFVDADLASGRLVRPVAHKAVCSGEWGLICRKDMKENPRIKKFIDWATAQVAAEARPAI